MGPEILLLAQLGVGSPDGARITARQLLDAPKSYVDRRIVLPDLPCVNDPRGGFVCVTTVAGRALRIEANRLGVKTALPIAARLTGECEGVANLQRSICQFDAEIMPVSTLTDTMDTASGSVPIVVVYSGQVELYRPKR